MSTLCAALNWGLAGTKTLSSFSRVSASSHSLQHARPRPAHRHQLLDVSPPAAGRMHQAVGQSSVLVVDSAQETYDPGADSVALWDKVELLSSTEQTERRLYFLLAASRGSNPSVSDLPSLPMDVGVDQTVPLR